MSPGYPMQSRLKAGTVFPKSSIINLELAPQELSATGLAVRREMVYLTTSVQATLTSQTTTRAVMRSFSLVSPVEVNLHFLTFLSAAANPISFHSQEHSRSHWWRWAFVKGHITLSCGGSEGL